MIDLLGIARELGKPLWRWLRRPALTVSVALGAPDCHLTPVSLKQSDGTAIMALGYFFRLWIFNEGHAPAEQVRVFVARVLRRDAQGGYRIVREFLPMNLLWTHIGGTEAPWLQSRMGQHCEFGRIFRHAHEYFDLAVEVLPLTEWHRLQPGAYRVDLQVAAANCKPALSTVELVFSGQWSNDEAQMFREGVALTVFGPAARERVFD